LPAEPVALVRKINWVGFWRSLLRETRRLTTGRHVVLGIGKPSALAVHALQSLQVSASFFDAMDDFPEFYQGLSRLYMRKIERKIAQSVTYVIASTPRLQEKFRAIGTPSVLIPNAYAMDNLIGIEPAERVRREILGYIGTVAEWFDWDLIVHLAEVPAVAEIRIVGPVFVPPPCKLPEKVRLFPACSQVEAVDYVRQFDIGLIPFKCTGLTAGVDPIKFYEYRALGLPVLSTRFGGMENRQGESGVYFIEPQLERMSETVRAALVYESNVEEVNKFRAENAWSSRFEQVHLIDLLYKPTRPVRHP
jgi:glycosyltransferase involved in cell wall biosynthesis